MQKAPVMKGSGLKPLDEIKADDEVAHVFGKNLEERVVTEEEEKADAISFADVPAQKNKEEDDIELIKKRKFDARTGEENEETIFQGDFKLFVWDLSTSNWIEKGRGQLKLNDPIDDSNVDVSRLIMRICGTLRIILNVAIRHSTFRVINNSKTSIRFTDSQTVWAASGNNAHQLKEFIDERLKIAEEIAKDEKKRSVPDDESSTPPKRSKTDASCLESKLDEESSKQSPEVAQTRNSCPANKLDDESSKPSSEETKTEDSCLENKTDDESSKPSSEVTKTEDSCLENETDEKNSKPSPEETKTENSCTENKTDESNSCSPKGTKIDESCPASKIEESTSREEDS